MMPDCRIDVRFFAPSPEFADCFTSIYRLELSVGSSDALDRRAEDWLQPEWGNLRVFSGDLPSARVAGFFQRRAGWKSAKKHPSKTKKFAAGMYTAWSGIISR